jgi:CheY-like chemotaxis protein
MSRILIVQEDTADRALLVAVLQQENYDVVTAENGLRALDVAQRERPDLIVMDVTLPDLDGYEVTRRLKAQRTTQHLPIIAIGANAAPAERERALSAGCDGFLAAPLDWHALPEQLRLFLP